MFLFDSDVDVSLLIEQLKTGQHKCLTGRVVKFYSERTRSDLEKRIEDAVHSRNDESHRTDARSYYNGVLKVLRRKLRDVNRELAKKELNESFTLSPGRPRIKRRGNTDQRVLKLSGII